MSTSPDILKSLDELPVYVPSDGQSLTQQYRQDPFGVFLKPYETLGPIFRCNFVGRDVIAMGGLEANEFVWSHNEFWDYHKTNAHFREQFDESYLNQLEGEAFTKKRRRTAQGFKPSMLMSHTGRMSRVLFEEVGALQGKLTEMRMFCMRLYVCMAAQVLLQVKLPKGMDQTMAISNKDMLRAPTLGEWRHLFYWKPARMYRRWKIFRYLNSLIEAREKNPSVQEDVFSLILANHPKDAPPIPRQELIYDLSQLFMGGSTTTSQVILWALMYLHKHPEWLAELREELKTWDPDNFTSMSPWPKLKATLLEIERLCPPSGALTRYTAQDFTFKGYHVPKGTPVLHLQTLCHFLPEIYPDPFTFRPQRFLENPSLPPKFAHGIFGGGAHMCVGQPLVRILTPLLVANVVTRYDLQFETDFTLRAKQDVVNTPVESEIWAKFVMRSP